jgi:hypothetical protein
MKRFFIIISFKKKSREKIENEIKAKYNFDVYQNT